MKAISVNVMRNDKYGDCTNSGVSSKFNELLVECPDGFIDIDMDNIPANFCRVNKRYLFGKYVYSIEPYKRPDKGCVGWMMGGNFAHSSDARFSEMIGGMYGAVAIHDRQETTEEYEMLCR